MHPTGFYLYILSDYLAIFISLLLNNKLTIVTSNPRWFPSYLLLYFLPISYLPPVYANGFSSVSFLASLPFLFYQTTTSTNSSLRRFPSCILLRSIFYRRIHIHISRKKRIISDLKKIRNCREVSICHAADVTIDAVAEWWLWLQSLRMCKFESHQYLCLSHQYHQMFLYFQIYINDLYVVSGSYSLKNTSQ